MEINTQYKKVTNEKMFFISFVMSYLTKYFHLCWQIGRVWPDRNANTNRISTPIGIMISAKAIMSIGVENLLMLVFNPAQPDLFEPSRMPTLFLNRYKSQKSIK
jgi:hypothetical protein